MALPLVYAFLPGKRQDLYKEVIQVVQDAAAQFQINVCLPARIMTDFELGIIRAAKSICPNVQTSCCFFHLGQSMYCQIQTEGLATAYNDKDDRTIKTFTNMLLALAYVLVRDVKVKFQDLCDDCPDELIPIINYFGETYVVGQMKWNRPVAPPRYTLSSWNQYEAALHKEAKTNNVSEGWHNRFRLIVAKHHPDLYLAIRELQKEQSYTKT